MRAVVGADGCRGHGVCTMHAPAVFDLRDADGPVVVTMDPIPPDHEAAVRRAEGNCPESAISVVVDEE